MYILYYIISYYIILNQLHYITLHYITLHYIILYYIILYYITLHYIILYIIYYITLYYIILISITPEEIINQGAARSRPRTHLGFDIDFHFQHAIETGDLTMRTRSCKVVPPSDVCWFIIP